MTVAKLTLGIIRPSSREQNSDLDRRMAELSQLGIVCKLFDSPYSAEWPYTASSPMQRVESLEQALLDPEVVAILSARGGYGASDLLPHIHWDMLSQVSPKPIIGFSDVSTLHAAFYRRLGWPGLHAPMPGSGLWEASDLGVQKLVQILLRTSPEWLEVPVQASWNARPDFHGSGLLMGGCMSVLTNLIGTPYFPDIDRPFILFLEDTDESPARIMRYLNQWIQSGTLFHCLAIILGVFRNAKADGSDWREELGQQFARRTGLPVLFSESFGHIKNNIPIGFGCRGQITPSALLWETKDVIPTAISQA